MKKGEKKKRERALKKRTESKVGRKAARATGIAGARAIREARSYPLVGCWVQQGWDKGGLAVVVVARRQPDGRLVFGNYLVDRFCLGLKNTFCRAGLPAARFEEDLLPGIISGGPPVGISADLAHEIIYGGIEFAARYGFRPHRDFALCQYVLDPPEAHPRTGAVEFGRNGRPLYIAGPHDDAAAIVRQLERTAGPGNYDYVVFVGDPGALEP